MELREASAFAMSLKGAAFSCLFFMYAMRHDRRNWTRNELADLTGWSRERVATGLRRLAVHGLVFQQNYESWQLTDAGYQLELENLRVSLNDSESQFKRLSGSSSSLKNHDMHEQHDSLKPPLLRVSLNDSQQIPDPIFDELVQALIRCGAAPKTATKAIDKALAAGTDPKEIELRILWWRGYCLTRNGMDHPGNLIAARVGDSIDTPVDFEARDIPHRFSELREDLEEFERQYQKAEEEEVTHD